MNKDWSTTSTRAASLTGSLCSSEHSGSVDVYNDRDSLQPADSAYLDSQEFAAAVAKRRHHELQFVKSNDVPGTTCYLVASSWAETWKAFVCRPGAAFPGPVDNTGLIDQRGCLHKPIDASLYISLNRIQWLFLLRCYGGGPTVRIFNMNTDGTIKQLENLTPGCELLAGRQNFCKHASCIGCSAKREARVLLGLGVTGPTPGHFPLILSQIRAEMESEVKFIDLLQDPRFAELRVVAGRREKGREDFEVAFEALGRLDPEHSQLFKERPTDLRFFLTNGVRGPCNSQGSLGSLIGAVHALEMNQVDKSFFVVSEMIELLNAGINKRKHADDTPVALPPASPFKLAKPNWLMEVEADDV